MQKIKNSEYFPPFFSPSHFPIVSAAVVGTIAGEAARSRSGPAHLPSDAGGLDRPSPTTAFPLLLIHFLRQSANHLHLPAPLLPLFLPFLSHLSPLPWWLLILSLLSSPFSHIFFFF